MKRFTGFISVLSDGHLLIASAAAAFTWSGFVQLQAVADPVVIALTGFATLATYNIQTLLRRFAPHKTEQFAPLHVHLFFALFGFAGSIYFFALAPPDLILWLVLPGILSILYATPVFPFRGLKIALRGVPYLKIWLILAVWMWVTAVIPLIFTDTENRADAWLFLLQRGLLIFSLLIPFDIRDLKTDYDFQRTLPQIIGIRTSTWIALTAVGGYIAVSLVRYSNGHLTSTVSAAIVLTGLYALFLIAGTRQSRPDYYYTVFIDSVLLVQPLLIRLFMEFV